MAPRQRLSAEKRRAQLMDVATVVLLEDGFDALTMESLVRRAGVSRGLAYVHFKNAEDLVLELYERELSLVYRRLVGATAVIESLEDGVRAGLSAYLDYVTERGNILAVLSSRLMERDRQGKLNRRLNLLLEGWAHQVASRLKIEHRHAMALAGAMLAVADAFARTWKSGGLSRDDAETQCVAFVLAGIRAAAEIPTTKTTAKKKPQP